MAKRSKIAVAGSGIYGSTIAIRLAKTGHVVTLFDPLGILCAASAINQFRLHKGYHYPRSPETITEILEARDEFIREYKAAVVSHTENYYAIPHQGSKTSLSAFEKICDSFSLSLETVHPTWINFNFIDRCYLVDESLYDPEILRSLIINRIKSLGIHFEKARFVDSLRDEFDFVVYATYGTSGSHMHLFEKIQLQVAEKILIKLPCELVNKSLVVIDGPFTGFDPFGNSEYSQFGSAQLTNHWATFDPQEPIPAQYAPILNAAQFVPVSFTHFKEMVHAARTAVPLVDDAEYIGSRFTLRLVEHTPPTDRRILRVGRPDGKTFHVFSGKVLSAVKAARIIDEQIAYA